MKLKKIKFIIGFLTVLLGTTLAFAKEEPPEAGIATITVNQSEATVKNVDVSAKVYELYTRLEWKLETWTDYVCEYEPGEGKGNWHGYYKVPKAEKPAALTAAIRGIGQSRAQDIVDSGLRPAAFTPKPRSWNAFKDEIRRIEREVSLEGLYGEVVSRYGRDNRDNLGYGTDENCRLVTHTELVPYSVTEKRLLRILPKIIDVYVKGADLLSGESDVIDITYNGSSVMFNTSLNTYLVSGGDDDGVYYLQAQGRKPARPNASDFHYSLLNKNGILVLTILDSKAEEAKLAGYELNVTLTLKKKKRCRKGETIVSKPILLQGGVGEIDLNALAAQAGKTLDSGTYYIEEMTFERLKTKYFNDKSGIVETGEVAY